MKQVLLPLIRIGIFAFACLHFSSKVANAQVTADDTVNTQVNQSDNVSEITGGETRGDNLFHSFQEFSVGAGNEAFFNNAEAIANIFSRVTGGGISQIDGLIRANGSANLFLINPAGITFGEGASLKIGGSFYGSTADSILFEDGEFSASDLENTPVLTINAPIGLGFRDNPQDVINQSGALDNSTGQFISGLQVPEGKNLALIGGDVRFDGGYVFAPGGRVELGGLSAAGTISFNDDGSFSFPEGIVRGDVFFNQGALAAVNGSEGGNLTVNTNNLEISGNSGLLGGTFADTGIADGQSGDIVVDATGEIAIDTSTISNVVQAGNGGDIQITANSLSLDNSAIDNSTEGSGNAGNLEIKASDSVNLSGNGILVDVTVNKGATGKGGNATVNAETLTLTDGAQISASTFGSGDGGSLSITANQSLSLNGSGSAIGSQVEPDAVGNAGDVALNTSKLSLAEGAFLSTATLGEGDAGRLDITADSITVNASQIRAEVGVNLTENNESTQATGKGGIINIDTETLNVTNGGQISIATFGTGDAGDLEINALDSVNLSGAGILIDATVGSTSNEDGTLVLATGNGGNVNFNTKNFSLTKGGQISSSTFGAGNAGNITVNASDTVSFEGTDSQGFPSGIFSNVEAGGEGDGGEIKITAGSLSLLNGGQLNAFVRAESETASGGNGDAGKVTLNIRNDATIAGVNEKGTRSGIFSDVETGATGNAGGIDITTGNLALTDGALLSSSTSGTGNAGGIELTIGNLFVTDGAQLSSSTSGTGNAGNITVNASDTVSFEGTDSEGKPSAAFSNVEAGAIGDGGEIKITAGSLSLLNGGQLNAFVRAESVTASGGNGDAGKVTLNILNDTTIAGVNENGTRSGITSSVETGATGNAGGIDITTDNLAVTNGAQLSSSTFGAGNAGNITVNANDTVSFEDTDSLGNPSAVFSNVDVGGVGIAGNISITANSISLTNGAQLQSGIVQNLNDFTKSGLGIGGNIKLNAEEDITLSGRSQNEISSGILTGVEEQVVFGNAGNIELDADSLTLTDGAQLNTRFSGLLGNAGNITVKADSLTLDDNSSITSSSIPSEAFSEDFKKAFLEVFPREAFLEVFPGFSPEASKGGNVTINFQDVLKLSGGSVIDAQATGESNGGNITINAPDGFIVAFPNQNNDITANAVGGAGGKINITAESVFGIEKRDLNDRTNDINASSGVLGLDGTVNLNTSDINPLQGTTELPSNVVEAKQTTEQVCSVDRQTGTASGLTVKGRGGVQPSPDLPLSSQTIVENGKNVAAENNEAQVSAIAPIHTSQGDIIPAQGILRTKDGRLILTAYRTDGNSRLPQGSANCTSTAPLK